MVLSFEEIERRISYLNRGVEEIIDRNELAIKIENADKDNRSLVVKLGVDPTAPDLHLGHTVPLMKLKHFQDLGYDVDFLIGDFTARIGDPSGRSKERIPMNEEDVLKNAKEYQKQIFKILNPDQTNIVYNSKWINSLKLDEFILVLGKGTVNDLVKRRSVEMRMEKGNPVSVAEFIYPFLQAYDSVAMKADVEIGGRDQYFNFVFAREMQRSYGQEPQVIMTLPLLIGIDGKEKMSKTYKNHVALDDKADDMYGKIMSIPDSLIINYFDLLTSVDYQEITEMESGMIKGTLHPRNLKARLANEIVTQYHGKLEANKSEEEFNNVHRYRLAPENISVAYLDDKDSKDIGQLLYDLGMTKSKSEGRRLVKQGGVRIDGESVSDMNYVVSPEEGMVINIGKRRFKKITYER